MSAIWGKIQYIRIIRLIYERHHTSSWCLTDCMTEFSVESCGCAGRHRRERKAAVPPAAGESVSDTELAGRTEAVGETETEEAPRTREFCMVDDDWFDDAVFIGDSRTVGLRDYGGLDNATFTHPQGLESTICGRKSSVMWTGRRPRLRMRFPDGSLAKSTSRSASMRWEEEPWTVLWSSTCSRFRNLENFSPDAIIYVQGIMRVAKAKSDSDKIFNNRGINERNMRIAELADNQTIFYIDVNDVVCDADGNLRADLV